MYVYESPFEYKSYTVSPKYFLYSLKSLNIKYVCEISIKYINHDI